MRTLCVLLALVLTGCATKHAPLADPLVGRWRQPETCAAPVRELVFQADGMFTVTYFPFETYRDYWGHWRRGPHDGLTLIVEGRNNNGPRDATLTGHVAIEDNMLRLEGIDLGAPPGQPSCTEPFTR